MTWVTDVLKLFFGVAGGVLMALVMFAILGRIYISFEIGRMNDAIDKAFHRSTDRELKELRKEILKK